MLRRAAVLKPERILLSLRRKPVELIHIKLPTSSFGDRNTCLRTRLNAPSSLLVSDAVTRATGCVFVSLCHATTSADHHMLLRNQVGLSRRALFFRLGGLFPTFGIDHQLQEQSTKIKAQRTTHHSQTVRNDKSLAKPTFDPSKPNVSLGSFQLSNLVLPSSGR